MKQLWQQIKSIFHHERSDDMNSKADYHREEDFHYFMTSLEMLIMLFVDGKICSEKFKDLAYFNSTLPRILNIMIHSNIYIEKSGNVMIWAGKSVRKNELKDKLDVLIEIGSRKHGGRHEELD